METRRGPEAAVVEIKALRVCLNRKAEAMEFRDLTGKLILNETERGKFTPVDDERIYGLGQHQVGHWNYRKTMVHLRALGGHGKI